MLRITVETVPNGDESKAAKLDEIKIINNLSHCAMPEFGNYVVVSKVYGKMNVYDHDRKLGYEKLLYKVFKMFENLACG